MNRSIGPRWARRAMVVGVVGVVGVLASGCSGPQKDVLNPPQPILSPYSGGEVAWAVVPPRNESGASELDTLAIGDALVASAEEIRGVRCAPLNRTIEAMRALKMDGLSSAADAKRLAQAMRVDGVLVSTVTAWDPYRPEIGLAVALFARPGAMEVRPVRSDSGRDFQTQTIDSGAALNTTGSGDAPLALVSEHFDSRNNQVLADLQTYATGRLKGPTALGWRSYASTSQRFTEFATYRTLEILMQQEWRRVSAGQSEVTPKPDNLTGQRGGTNQVVAGQVHRLPTEN